MTDRRSETPTCSVKTSIRFSLVLGLLVACGGASACQAKDDPGSKQPAASAVTLESPAASPGASPASTGGLLDAYEAVRVKLANDQLPGDSADQLARRATEAGATEVYAAAAKLQSIQEIEAARKQFGEVSRELVERWKKAPPPDTLHVYECPMAQGYGKWLQKEEQMANPYMGQRMLECGSKSEL